jgi:signal peptidase II
MDDTPDDLAPPWVSARRLQLAMAATTLVVLVADQVTKYLAVSRLTENVPVTVISGLFQLRLIRNPGAAFSLSTGTTWVFTIIAATVSMVIVRIARRIGSIGWALALGLLLGGAVGNLLDRLLREPGFGRGHVVDFIEYLKFPFTNFPIFNVADSCIVVSAGLIAILGVRNIPVEGRPPVPQRSTDG